MNKKRTEAKKLVDKSKRYTIDEALELLPKLSLSKFVGSAEIIVNLKLTEKHKKQSPVRGSVVFPNAFGENVTILVLTEKPDEALAAGADFAGLDDYMKKIEKGWDEFNIVIATPSVMPKIAKLGKYLGKKGLMPNPRNNTIAAKVEDSIKLYKSGKRDYKQNEQDAIKIAFGKLDMSTAQLKDNLAKFLESLKTGLSQYSGDILKNAYMSPTMGPSVKIDTKELQ